MALGVYAVGASSGHLQKSALNVSTRFTYYRGRKHLYFGMIASEIIDLVDLSSVMSTVTFPGVTSRASTWPFWKLRGLKSCRRAGLAFIRCTVL